MSFLRFLPHDHTRLFGSFWWNVLALLYLSGFVFDVAMGYEWYLCLMMAVLLVMVVCVRMMTVRRVRHWRVVQAQMDAAFDAEMRRLRAEQN